MLLVWDYKASKTVFCAKSIVDFPVVTNYTKNNSEKKAIKQK